MRVENLRRLGELALARASWPEAESLLDQALSEDFSTNLGELSLDEVRSRRDMAEEVERELSYYHRLLHGRRVEALTFLSDVAHPQWAGALTLERQAELIAGAQGLSGRNADYLRDLVDHLREMRIRDPAMEALLALVEAREA